RLHISLVVTLEEEATLPAAASRLRGLQSLHFPIVDMGVPTSVTTAALCKEIAAQLKAGERVAFHCRAGQGRTGTMLVCQLIWSGKSACSALEHVRAINPRCVESDAQVAFLAEFERYARSNSTQPCQSLGGV